MSNNKFVYSTLLTSILFMSVPVFQVACRSHTSTSTQLSDSSITASVKSKMMTSSKVKAGDIDVNTEEGTVYLVGRVGTASERTEAERLAWTCDGVRKVVNDIKVGGTG